MADRYDTSGNIEAQYQPGSDDQVLLNKLGIVDVEEMDQAELDALILFQDALLEEIEVDQRLAIIDISQWHRQWLGDIYEWAGQYRSVNMAKGDFVFAAAHLIPKLVAEFEEKYLSRYTPCGEMDVKSLAEALAICHIEFIIIHPYREGNGRLGRVLATVMALQAGMPPLDFALLETQKDRYIAAIHAGHAGSYEPMTELFSEILQYSLDQAAGR